jgi:hypothetical protein
MWFTPGTPGKCYDHDNANNKNNNNKYEHLRNAYNIFVENMKRRHQLRKLVVDWRTILKCILNGV